MKSIIGLIGLGITFLPIAELRAGYLHTNCAAEVIATNPKSRINIRAMPSTNAPILSTLPVGAVVVILNADSRELSPLSRRGMDQKNWYLILPSRDNRPDGLVPQKDAGWIREDLLRFICPP